MATVSNFIAYPSIKHPRCKIHKVHHGNHDDDNCKRSTMRHYNRGARNIHYPKGMSRPLKPYPGTPTTISPFRTKTHGTSSNLHSAGSARPKYNFTSSSARKHKWLTQRRSLFGAHDGNSLANIYRERRRRQRYFSRSCRRESRSIIRVISDTQHVGLSMAFHSSSHYRDPVSPVILLDEFRNI
jgi:hypothetical protein